MYRKLKRWRGPCSLFFWLSDLSLLFLFVSQSHPFLRSKTHAINNVGCMTWMSGKSPHYARRMPYGWIFWYGAWASRHSCHRNLQRWWLYAGQFFARLLGADKVTGTTLCWCYVCLWYIPSRLFLCDRRLLKLLGIKLKAFLDERPSIFQTTTLRGLHKVQLLEDAVPLAPLPSMLTTAAANLEIACVLEIKRRVHRIQRYCTVLFVFHFIFN